MKQYDSKLKKWVTQEEYDKSHKHRDKDICRGQKPHDFVLVLPNFISYNEKYKFNPEAYYQIMKEVDEFEIKQSQRLADMGILKNFGTFSRHQSRLYICSVCKKHKYEYA